MPSDWNLSVLYSVLKNCDLMICANYWQFSLIVISYTVLSSVICERLKPHANKLFGPYQCDFRPGKSSIDQIFGLHQILKKSHEKKSTPSFCRLNNWLPPCFDYGLKEKDKEKDLQL